MTFEEGMASYCSGDFYSAAEKFRLVTEADGDNHKAWNALGICLTKMGKNIEANNCFETALLLNPGNVTYEKNREINNKTVPKTQKISEEKTSDRSLNKIAIFFAFIGFLIGFCIAAFLLLIGGIGSAVNINESNIMITRAWIVTFLCFLGLFASLIRHKQYGSIILIFNGVFIILLISLLGILPGVFFVIAGYLLFREIKFDPNYYTNFKTDTVKKILFTAIILSCLVFTAFGLMNSAPNQISTTEKTYSDISNSVTIDKTSTKKATFGAVITSIPIINPPLDSSKVAKGSLKIDYWEWDESDIFSVNKDGIAIYPGFLDDNEEVIKWEGDELPVTIELWTKNYKKGDLIRDTLIFSGSDKISSWEDGKLSLSPGIRIPFTEIKMPKSEIYAAVVTYITLPDGRIIETEIYPVSILKKTS